MPFPQKLHTILTLLFFLTTTLPTFAQETYTLTVQLLNVRNNKGNILAQLENQDGQIINIQSAKATKGMVTLQFDQLNAGTYAITILHDENDNQKIDTNMLGIPKEGWACSNNARAFMAAPKLKDKLFDLNNHKTITPKMVYY